MDSYFERSKLQSKLSDKGYQALKQQNFLLSYLYLKQAYTLDPTSAINIERYIQIKFMLRNFHDIIKLIENLTKSIDTTQQGLLGDLFFYKLKALIELGRFQDLEDSITKARKHYSLSSKREKIGELDKLLRLDLPRQKENFQLATDAEKQKECLEGQRALDRNDYPIKINESMYIMPIKWLNKWKFYTGYENYFGEGDEMVSEDDETTDLLGPITLDHILDNQFNLNDPNPSEFYTNLQLKPGVEEGKDFILMNETSWNFFYSKYGGTPMTRFSFQGPKKTISVEIQLQQVNCVLMPIPNKQQYKKLKSTDIIYISRFKTIRELKAKLVSIYCDIFETDLILERESRMWKVNPNFDLFQEWDNWKASSGHFNLLGEILQEDAQIEVYICCIEITLQDAELSVEDIVIFESRLLKDDWFIKGKNNTTKTIDKLLRKAQTQSSSTILNGEGRRGLVGLQNLGNTCFMNSALQCMSNTQDITEYFLYEQYKQDLNETNPLGTGGKLAESYADLLRELWVGNASCVSPWNLKKVIGKFAPQFTGFHQHDSQEFLSYFIDGLHEDLNRIHEKPMIETKDYDGSRPDKETSFEAWNNYVQRNQSIIQERFHGQLKSTLNCPGCKRVSITFDPFVVLSVPLVQEESTDSYYKLPCKVVIPMTSTSRVNELKKKLAIMMGAYENQIVLCLLKNHCLMEILPQNTDIKYVENHEDICFAYQLTDLTSKPLFQDLEKRILKINVVKEERSNHSIEPSHLSFTRIIVLDETDTFYNIELKIYAKMRSHLHKYLMKLGKESPILLDEKRTLNILDYEYKKLFIRGKENEWFYSLTLIEKKNEKSKALGILSQFNESDTLSDLLIKSKLKYENIQVDLKFNSIFSSEDFKLNQCTDYLPEKQLSTGIVLQSLEQCLDQFTKNEQLSKENEWYCNRCKKHQQAFKKMEIYNAPDYLILHLKRFRSTRSTSSNSFNSSNTKKIDSKIDFPLENLELKKFILSDDKKSTLYNLYGVINHMGGTGGGHYTAYAINSMMKRWYKFDDSKVSTINSNEVITASAYVLFYQRKKSKF